MPLFQKGDRRNAFNMPPICHPDRPYYAKDLCTQCYRAKYNPKYYKENKDVIAETNKVYVKKNRSKTSSDQRKWALWRFFRLTPEDYKKVLTFQGNVCAISGKPPKSKSLAVDHDHKSGKIRGLLSMQVNRGLAMFNDDPVLLRKTADYLENPPAVAALGKAVYGLIGQAKAKKKMVYGSENGPIKSSKKKDKS